MQLQKSPAALWAVATAALVGTLVCLSSCLKLQLLSMRALTADGNRCMMILAVPLKLSTISDGIM